MKKIVACMLVLVFGLAGISFGQLSEVGFTATGPDGNINPLAEDCDGYVLWTDGEPDSDYYIDFNNNTTSDVPLDTVGLFLVDIKVQDPASLVQYYNDRGVPEPYLTYLVAAVNSEKPFAFIGTPDTSPYIPVSLYDGAHLSVGGVSVPMIIPGNYPCGTYTVATEDGGISFALTILGSHCGDADGDCYPDDQDLCLDTGADEPDRRLGVNRWVYNDEGVWEKGRKKGKGKGSDFEADMWYTYGCSCEQILDAMSDVTGGKFKGHYKFGCSKSILEDWNSGVYILDDGTEIELW